MANPSPSDNPEQLRTAAGLLALLALPGIGPTKALRAALMPDSHDELLSSHDDRWGQALADAERELEVCEQHGISVLAIFDQSYPDRLRALHDPPPVLYVHGSVEVLNQSRMAAVVGTREPTQFGVSAAEQLTHDLADAKWAVISGLAKGIDTVAHGAALKHHTPTVAVMAGGLDRIYPAENRELAAAIVDQGGALIAEQRWGAAPQRSSFVDRNRIQTGLAVAVIVVQTGLAGGTLHTARHAAEQGRPIFCPVPSSGHERSAGLRALLEAPARDLWQILPAWKNARALCERLGDQPLAHPIARETVDDFLDVLELALQTDPQMAEPRWWPTAPPAAHHHPRGIVADEAQDSLFAISD